MPGKIFALLGWGQLLFFPSLCLAGDAHAPFMLDTAVGLNAYQALVEEYLAGAFGGLKALAATEEATSGNWDRMKGPLEEFGKAVPTNAAIWFAKPDGFYATVEKGPAKETLKDRAYFSALMAGNAVTGNLVVSKSTGERSIVVAVPIVRNGKIIGALGASLSAAKIAKLVSDEIGRPHNVIFYALDAQGQTALHSDPALIFAFPSDIGDASLKSAVQKMLSEPQGSVDYDFRGVRRTAIFQRSKATRWVFVLGIVHAH